MPFSADPKEKKILIVDDDESVLELLGFIVGKEGFQVATALDGVKALEAVEASPPDLILLDLMLPRYGGFEVLRRLQSGESSRIPIVVITGKYTDRSTVDLIRQESNVVEFFEKPLKPQVLTPLLHRILQTRPRDLDRVEEKKKELGTQGAES
ncbi:MAG: response regulator [Elusimicrobia bacterium]|nr:response regulator [Elusimicrobiota bacterium]